MIKRLSCLLVMLTLSACSTYAPGADKKGQELQAQGSRVLEAVREYMDQNARPPRSLSDVVPKYLDALPAEPQINYDAKNSRLDFTYQQEGKTGMMVACHAVIGQTEWACTGIYQRE